MQDNFKLIRNRFPDYMPDKPEEEHDKPKEAPKKKSDGEFNPSVNVSEMVILVTEKSDKHYGQIAALTAHDWNDQGMYHVKFSDGTNEQYPDGIVLGDPKSPVEKFHRKNKDHMDEFKKHYIDIKIANVKSPSKRKKVEPVYMGVLKVEYEQLFGEKLP
jgi:hypothetical protein